MALGVSFSAASPAASSPVPPPARAGGRLSLSRSHPLLAELDPVPAPNLFDGGLAGLRIQARELPEKLLDPSRHRHPGHLQQAGAGVAQAMPRLPGHVEQGPRNDRRRLGIECGASLALVDKRHRVFAQMAVQRKLRPWRDGRHPHRDRRSGPVGVDFNGDVAGPGGAELEDLPLGRLENPLHASCQLSAFSLQLKADC